MRNVRLHPDFAFDGLPSRGNPAPQPNSHTHPGRLNLLLSYVGWHPDPWVDRLPVLLQPMGVTSHLAGNGREARSVIERIHIHIAVVDLGLPLDDSQPLSTTLSSTPDSDDPATLASDLSLDLTPDLNEGGPRLLELLTRLEEPPPVVAIKRGRNRRDDTRDMQEALRLGAFAVVDRPREADDLNIMLNVLQRCLERRYGGTWPQPPQPPPPPSHT